MFQRTDTAIQIRPWVDDMFQQCLAIPSLADEVTMVYKKLIEPVMKDIG